MKLFVFDGIWVTGLLFLILTLTAVAAPPLPADSSPEILTDWRHLARPLSGTRKIISDPWGRVELEPAGDGKYVVLDVRGTGVMDCLWNAGGRGILSIEVDGNRFFNGNLQDAVQSGQEDANALPVPLLADGGGMFYFAAPVGFAESLRITVDQPHWRHYISYRILPANSSVMVAQWSPESPYAMRLRDAAAAWQSGVADFIPAIADSAAVIEQDFTLAAGSRVVAFAQDGAGEIVHLQFKMLPPLVGTLREVVVEFFYGDATAPSLRLPLPDLVGVVHPWAISRWHHYNGTLAAGIRYPWMVQQPRFHHPEVTFRLNLPIPFTSDMRIELWNRSESTRFTGNIEVHLLPLADADAARVGKLCGSRGTVPLQHQETASELLRISRSGNLVALSLFTTGGAHFPAQVIKDLMPVLRIDQEPDIEGHALAPLWFQGIYGGPQINKPLWNHPLMEDQFAGVTRYFLTDPIPFTERLTFLLRTSSDTANAPKTATTVILWYDFGAANYAAPELPTRAEILPFSRYRPRLRSGSDGRTVWVTEAEKLVEMMHARGTIVRAVQDDAHNYHPSAGRYLHITAANPGDTADFAVPLPPDTYVSVGSVVLWGPNRGHYEVDLVAPEQLQKKPEFAQSDALYLGRATGGLSMEVPLFIGRSLQLRRDSNFEWTRPLLNPSPDDIGYLRFICQGKPLDSNAYIAKIDLISLSAPPPAADGWHEFERGVTWSTPAGHGLQASRPKYGRYEWSGWGALRLAGRAGDEAVIHCQVATAASQPLVLILRATAENDTAWSCNLNGQSIVLKPDGEEKVKQWRLPLEHVAVPGIMSLQFRCLATPEQRGRSTEARLYLDSWKVAPAAE